MAIIKKTYTDFIRPLYYEKELTKEEETTMPFVWRCGKCFKEFDNFKDADICCTNINSA